MKSGQNENTFCIITFDGIHEKIFIETSLVNGQPMEFLYSSGRVFSRLGRPDDCECGSL